MNLEFFSGENILPFSGIIIWEKLFKKWLAGKSLQEFQYYLNRVSSFSLLMSSSTALANEGLFELTLR